MSFLSFGKFEDRMQCCLDEPAVFDFSNQRAITESFRAGIMFAAVMLIGVVGLATASLHSFFGKADATIEIPSLSSSHVPGPADKAPTSLPAQQSVRIRILELAERVPSLISSADQDLLNPELFAGRIVADDLPVLSALVTDTDARFRARFFALRILRSYSRVASETNSLVEVAVSEMPTFLDGIQPHSVAEAVHKQEFILRKVAIDAIAQNPNRAMALTGLRQVQFAQVDESLRGHAARLVPYVEKDRYEEYRAKEEQLLKRAVGAVH